jgi:steroid 5-alpha reductase family enzyme
MSPAIRRALIALTAILLLAAALAFAGSDNGQQVGGIPIYAMCILLAFVINWIAFIPASANQTEKYYDLTGAITNTSLPLLAVTLSPVVDARSWLLLALVAVWAGRLGVFLFGRIQADGQDIRFSEIKRSPPRFFIAWSLQALWGCFSLAAALAAITATARAPIGAVGISGLLIWLLGFGFEVVADRQKREFRKDPANQGKFIQSGLWAWSRHPNYFGEIVLWLGVAVIALPVLSGWQWATLISPLFVIVQLTRISGLPMLEARADERWGGQPAYEAYKRQTPVLIPRPPRQAP